MFVIIILIIINAFLWRHVIVISEALRSLTMMTLFRIFLLIINLSRFKYYCTVHCIHVSSAVLKTRLFVITTNDDSISAEIICMMTMRRQNVKVTLASLSKCNSQSGQYDDKLTSKFIQR